VCANYECAGARKIHVTIRTPPRESEVIGVVCVCDVMSEDGDAKRKKKKEPDRNAIIVSSKRAVDFA